MSAGRIYLGDPQRPDYDVWMFDGRVTDAWSLIGAAGSFRIRGGRTIYTDVLAPSDDDRNRADRVRLAYLGEHLNQVNRWVDADTEVEVFEIDGDHAHLLGWIGPLRWNEDGEPYREEVVS